MSTTTMLSEHQPQWQGGSGPSPRLTRCLVLAALLHGLLVAWVGSAPPGSAAPGEGMWGALSVVVSPSTAAPGAGSTSTEAPAYTGPRGQAQALRWGGGVREPSVTPNDATAPGAARLGTWNPAVTERDAGAHESERPVLPVEMPAPVLPPAPLTPPVREAPGGEPVPTKVPAAAAPPAVVAAPMPTPAAQAAPLQQTAAAPVPMPAPVTTPAPAPVADTATEAPVSLRAPAPRALPSMDAPVLDRVATPAALPAMPSIQQAVTPAKLAAPVALEAAQVEAPPLAKPLPVAAPTLTPPVNQPLAAAPTATAAATAAPADSSAAGPTPLAPASLGPNTRIGAGRPEAGARLGHDVATPPTAAPSAPRLNLTMPGSRSAQTSSDPPRGVLQLLPRPPDTKSKLAKDIEKAGQPDCQKAYAGMGLLAVIPLAADAIRDKGCRW